MPLKGKCVGSEIHAACSIKINPWEKLAKGEKRLVAEGLISLCLVSSRGLEENNLKSTIIIIEGTLAGRYVMCLKCKWNDCCSNIGSRLTYN